MCADFWLVSSSLVRFSIVFFRVDMLAWPSPIEIPTIVILGRRGFGGVWMTLSVCDPRALPKKWDVNHIRRQDYKSGLQMVKENSSSEPCFWLAIYFGLLLLPVHQRQWIWQPVSKREPEVCVAWWLPLIFLIAITWLKVWYPKIALGNINTFWVVRRAGW